jgi:D-alanyl-D-alanine dipeptidase
MVAPTLLAMGAAVFTLLAALAAATASDTPAPDTLVDIGTVAPGIRLDIRYATANNFTKTVLYPEARCRLRYPVAVRLARVQAALQTRGLGLKVFDCYRPPSIQWKLWKLVPDPRYVADPRRGSRHSRGAAVDLTLVDAAGRELPMPTPYDAASEKSHRNYRQLPPALIRNRTTLEQAMTLEGFLPLPTEWWHFDAPDWERYPLGE